MTRGIFVTGTDTGVGKTAVAAALLRALVAQGWRAVGMKPVAAGVEADGRNADVVALAAASNVAAEPALVNPYCFAPPIAPHVAARAEGRAIELRVLADACATLARAADVVVVEGAGGALVPLGPDHDMLDVARACALPVLLVVGVRLGCLNHALLSALAIRARGLTLAGWVATRIDPAMCAAQDSVDELASRLPAPCVGDFPAADATAFAPAALARLGFARP